MAEEAGLPRSPEELESMIKSMSERLERFGLSSYEARAYLALIAHGFGDAETIAKTADIPRTSAYKVLEALEAKGFAMGTEGRPKIYKPEPPAKMQAKLNEEVNEVFTLLDQVHEVVREKGTPQLIFTIMGKDRVLQKIRELLELSTKEFYLSTPVVSEIRNAMEKEFKKALKRNVEVTVMTDQGQRPPPCSRVVRSKSLTATQLISDSKSALIAAPDLSACGYSDDEFLASHLKSFLLIAMEHSQQEKWVPPAKEKDEVV
jgi:sugar-specific transcriptional regulator TrmB